MTLRSPVVRMAGFLVVDPADTAIDMAASARSIDVLAVLDAALASGVRPQQLCDAVDRARRLRGIVEVRGQLCRASPKAESPMESRSRYRIYEAGLPEPELQIMVPIPTGGFRAPDMGWRRARIGLEFDGQEFHAGDGSLDRDRQRGSDLISAGWTVVHITARAVYRNPERFTGIVRDLLHQRPVSYTHL